MGRRGTNKPCPGCGQTALRRNPERVCSDCLRKFAEHAEFIKYVETGLKLKRFALPWHWPHFLYHDPGRARSDDFNGLERAFRSLLDAVGIDDPRSKHLTFNGQGMPAPWSQSDPGDAQPLVAEIEQKCHAGGFGKTIWAAPAAIQAIRSLDAAVRVIITEAYARGYDDASNALKQLACGAMTLEQLDEEDVKRANVIQKCRERGAAAVAAAKSKRRRK